MLSWEPCQKGNSTQWVPILHGHKKLARFQTAPLVPRSFPARLNCKRVSPIMKCIVYFCRQTLTHWDWVTHICVGKPTIIVSDNGLSPGRRQAIIWTNTGILLIGPLGTNFRGILIGIHTFSFEKMHSKISFAKWRPFCLGLNVLTRSLWWNELKKIINMLSVQHELNCYIVYLCNVKHHWLVTFANYT